MGFNMFQYYFMVIHDDWMILDDLGYPRDLGSLKTWRLCFAHSFSAFCRRTVGPAASDWPIDSIDCRHVWHVWRKNWLLGIIMYHTVIHTLSLSLSYYVCAVLLQLMTWNQWMKPWDPRCSGYWRSRCRYSTDSQAFQYPVVRPHRRWSTCRPKYIRPLSSRAVGLMLLHSLLVRTFKTLKKWGWFNVDSGDSGDSWSLQDVRRNIWQDMTRLMQITKARFC